jgi:hypothetical protein
MSTPDAPWWEKILEWLASLFGKAPVVVVTPPPVTTPPVPVTTSIPFPSGTIKTRGPNGRSLSHIPWSDIARWEPRFTDATHDPRYGRNRFGPLFLACITVIESEGQQYTTHQMTGTKGEVLRGHGDPRSIGLTQIRYDIHDPAGQYVFTADGNLNLAAKLWADWMEELGPWEAVLTSKWYPGTDPVSKISQQEYIRTVRDLIAEVKASWDPTNTGAGAGTPPAPGKSYAVAGLSAPITLPFPLHVDLLPASQTNQRPGIRMTPSRYVQHETGNPNPGQGARSHRNYLFAGAPDNSGRSQQLSYHFAVDETEAWQMIPVNEVTWHGGDGAGQCNMAGISCELAIENPEGSVLDLRAREHAEMLAAAVMKAAGVGAIVGHTTCCANAGNPRGCHSGCPERIMRAPGGLAGFTNRVLQRKAQL